MSFSRIYKCFPLWIFLLLSVGSCTDDTVSLPAPATDEGQTDNSLVYHDGTRTSPYPKMNNQIYLNPVPLMVPTAMKGDGLLQFALSRSADFPKESTILSVPERWCMYNPHRIMESGMWYWRFRPVSTDNVYGEWSETYCFEMTDEIPCFFTPNTELFLENIPTGHPRLHVYLNGQAGHARKTLSSHPEYQYLLNRANRAVKRNFADIASFYRTKSEAEDLKNTVLQLYQAYFLTQQSVYADKMLEIVRSMISRPPTEKELFSAPSNFVPTNIVQAYILIYDLLFDRLTPVEHTVIEEVLLSVVRFYYNVHVGKRENDLFDSHFWQFNMLVFFQCAYMLCDKGTYRDEVLPMLRYYYEIWTARAPGTGFNRDGVWHNSASYLNTNVETLYYMPSILSYITGTSFLEHPWYRNAGRSLAYTWPVGSRSCGFGDGSSGSDEPTRVRMAFADFLARRTGDTYARWYAGQGMSILQSDFLLRLDRMADSQIYDTALPQNMEKMVWYKDAGEVVMHSDLADTGNNLSLAFRSSRYGCTEHTFANENAFNVLYKGADVYRNTGYYLKYGSPYHITSCRHTRAHNTVLVNGIGQGFTTKAYGEVVRGLAGNYITYCLGDASQAYKDTCDQKSWLANFKAAGIAQTPEHGFGATPLTKYLRHIWMLHPDVVVIYDELEASEPVRWDWLLHSPTAFHIEKSSGGQAIADGTLLTTRNSEKDFATQARLFSTEPYSVSQTDRFVIPPTEVPDSAYPNQWHLNATVSDSRSNRFLFVMQVYGRDKLPAPIGGSGNTFSVGGWHIEAEMDSNREASVRITHESDNLIFDYSSATNLALPDGNSYRRQQSGSSILYEGGEVQEQSDYRPKHTRAVR